MAVELKHPDVHGWFYVIDFGSGKKVSLYDGLKRKNECVKWNDKFYKIKPCE